VAERGGIKRCEMSVRMDDFKLEGGELCKEGFCKLLSQE